MCFFLCEKINLRNMFLYINLLFIKELFDFFLNFENELFLEYCLLVYIRNGFLRIWY